MKKIVLIFLGLLSVIIANSQVSQDSAQTIMKSYFANYDDCDIYVTNNTIGIGDTIHLMGSMIIMPPQDSCWMFPEGSNIRIFYPQNTFNFVL